MSISRIEDSSAIEDSIASFGFRPKPFFYFPMAFLPRKASVKARDAGRLLRFTLIKLFRLS